MKLKPKRRIKGYHLIVAPNFFFERHWWLAMVLAVCMTGCAALHHALEPSGKIQDPPTAGTK